MENNSQYQKIITLMDSLAERIKILEDAMSKPQPVTRLGPSSVIKNSTDFWADIKEGGEFNWGKLK
jgi:hypothetical protein